MGTKASGESVREKRIRLLTSNLSAELQKIFTSCILTDQYPATTIAFQFTVLEVDSELLQTLINCGTLALFKSSLLCRCLPIAVTMLISGEANGNRQRKLHEWITLDPNIGHLKRANYYSHKFLLVWNVDTAEVISSSLVPLSGRP